MDKILIENNCQEIASLKEQASKDVFQIETLMKQVSKDHDEIE